MTSRNSGSHDEGTGRADRGYRQHAISAGGVSERIILGPLREYRTTANIIRLGVFIKETAFVKFRGVQAMINVEQDQVWEVYSSHENRWVRAIVFKIQDDRATLRYEGILEFITVDIGDMLSKPELFRPATAAENP